jgi:hypothetical protein
VFVEAPPAELRAWLDRRRRDGQDRFDEMWDGEYHVTPAPHGRPAGVDHQLARLLGPAADGAGLVGAGPLNVGEPVDHRVPDQAYLRPGPLAAFHPTAAIVVEILSPGDETLAKLPFHFRRGVEEVLLVDIDVKSLRWLVRADDEYEEAPASAILGLGSAALQAELRWPD